MEIELSKEGWTEYKLSKAQGHGRFETSVEKFEIDFQHLNIYLYIH